jgi:hypothetical protein
LEIPYAWYASGATAYQTLLISTVDPDTGSRFFRDTSGVLIATADLFTGRPHPALFRVLALDTAAGQFRQNITGALGRFGSASVLGPPKVVVWQ